MFVEIVCVWSSCLGGELNVDELCLVAQSTGTPKWLGDSTSACFVLRPPRETKQPSERKEKKNDPLNRPPRGKEEEKSLLNLRSAKIVLIRVIGTHVQPAIML